MFMFFTRCINNESNTVGDTFINRKIHTGQEDVRICFTFFEKFQYNSTK